MNELNRYPFNWVAAFFGFFWFPYKGLWREFRFYYVYFGLFHLGLYFIYTKFPEHDYKLQIVFIIIELILFIQIGKNASKRLVDYSFAKSYKNNSNNLKAGIIASTLFFASVALGVFLVNDYVRLLKFQRDSITRNIKFYFELHNNSMYPSYSIGDKLHIDTTVAEVYAGDVIAFKSEDGTVEIARVIGIEGDEIKRNDGEVLINNKRVTRKTISKGEFVDTLPEIYQEERFLIKQETIDEISYFTLVDESKFDNVNMIVPQKHIFIMFDNRTEEMDEGRLISVNNVIGVNLE